MIPGRIEEYSQRSEQFRPTIMRSTPVWIPVVKWTLVCALAGGALIGLSAMVHGLATGDVSEFALRAALVLFMGGAIGLMMFLAYLEMRFPTATRNTIDRDTHPGPSGDFGGSYAPDYSASPIAHHVEDGGDAGGDGGWGDGGGGDGGGGDGGGGGGGD